MLQENRRTECGQSGGMLQENRRTECGRSGGYSRKIGERSAGGRKKFGKWIAGGVQGHSRKLLKLDCRRSGGDTPEKSKNWTAGGVGGYLSRGSPGMSAHKCPSLIYMGLQGV